MRVFISWSGERSNRVATALRDWLPLALPTVTPWMSGHDVAAGQRWADEVGAQLEATDFGIIVVTPENCERPWLHFEAGAIAKAVETARVVPYLVGMNPSNLGFPLAMFQAAQFDKDGTRKLVASINSAIEGGGRDGAQLERIFELVWIDLKARLDVLPAPSDLIPQVRRSDREILEEVLAAVRAGSASQPSRADHAPVDGDSEEGADLPQWKIGQLVVHRDFGTGRILSFRMLNRRRVAHIDFQSVGRKHIVVPHETLTALDP